MATADDEDSSTAGQRRPGGAVMPWWPAVALAFGVAALIAFVGMRATQAGENVATPPLEAPEPGPELPAFVPDLPEVPDLSAGPAPGPPVHLDTE